MVSIHRALLASTLIIMLGGSDVLLARTEPTVATLDLPVSGRLTSSQTMLWKLGLSEKEKARCDRIYTYEIQYCKNRYTGSTTVEKRRRQACYEDAWDEYADCLKRGRLT